MFSANHTVGTLICHWWETALDTDKNCINYFSICFDKAP